MGAWGVGIFDNDDAGDWIYELEKSSGDTLLRATLGAAAQSADYLDAPAGCNALAAAAVVAALGGQALPDLSPDAVKWVQAQNFKPASDLLALAKAAVERVLGADSELHELWQESDELLAWKESVEQLQDALENAGG